MAFATAINIGPGMATSCSMSPEISIPAALLYQTSDPATNAPVGTPNTPLDIPEGASQSFVNLNMESPLVDGNGLVRQTPTYVFSKVLESIRWETPVRVKNKRLLIWHSLRSSRCIKVHSPITC
jgi:hypothetical protein